MKIILKENIENLGKKGDIVNVAAGFGRNYLLPKKLAIEVTASNMKMIEMEQAALRKHLEKARLSYQDVIQRLNNVSLSFERKAGEKDHIFGSVSVGDIKDELDKLGFEIEKKKIHLKDPIKRLGNYTVPIKVFLEDTAEIKIQVNPEGGAEEAAVPTEDKTVRAPQEKPAETKAEEAPAVEEDKSTGPEVSAPERPGEEEKQQEKPAADEKNKTSS